MTEQNDVAMAGANPLGSRVDSAHDQSFEAFYRHEYPGQFRRAALLVGSEADAGEAVAHAFTNIFERWDKLENPGAYLNRAVLNACRDIGRRRTKLTVVDADFEHSLADEYGSADLFAALHALPYKERAVVVLKHWVGLRERDIAEQLDIAQGSVGPTLSRAYKRLKPHLQEGSP